MKSNYVVLLGAGTSIDAGVPSSLELTGAVYERLRSREYGNQSILFGYVIAKLIARRVLAGGSPFDLVNIEEAFDALLRLISKESDIISEFVYSWDPILDSFKPQFNEGEFVNNLTGSLQRQDRLGSRGILSIDQHRLRAAARNIGEAISGSKTGFDSARIANSYIDILVSILANPPNDYSYINPVVQFGNDKNALIGTLNYDLLVEAATKQLGLNYSYGLDDWSSKQVLDWKRKGIRLLKLHGSINWSGLPDNFEVLEKAAVTGRWQRSKALMIFGGQGAKLTPQGPFLQLRHEFENSIMYANRLLIIGYSFGDQHINAILKRWITTRSKAKMVIVEPGTIPFKLDIFARSYISNGSSHAKKVDIVQVKQPASTGIKIAVEQIQKRIDTSVDVTRNGFLPQIWVKTID